MAPPPQLKPTSLADVPTGGRALLEETGGAEFRLLELGFVAGTEVTVLRRGTLRGPLIVSIDGATLCLRHRDAARIKVSVP